MIGHHFSIPALAGREGAAEAHGRGASADAVASGLKRSLTLRRSLNKTLWNVGMCPRSLRLDAGELDHLSPFVDISGDELGELVRRVRRHRQSAEISEPLLDARVKHLRVGLLVKRRDDLRLRSLRDSQTDPPPRLFTLNKPFILRLPPPDYYRP